MNSSFLSLNMYLMGFILLCSYLQGVDSYSLRSPDNNQEATISKKSMNAEDSTMPLPWTRELYLDTEQLEGNDVLIMCTLLSRDASVQAVSNGLPCDSIFDSQDQTGT